MRCGEDSYSLLQLGGVSSAEGQVRTGSWRRLTWASMLRLRIELIAPYLLATQIGGLGGRLVADVACCRGMTNAVECD